MAGELHWSLIYRDEADYREILSRTASDPEAFTAAYEPLQANMFVVAHRR